MKQIELSDEEFRKLVIGPLVMPLVMLRNALRNQPNYTEADGVRDQLKELGFELEDRSYGTVIFFQKQIVSFLHEKK